MTKNVLPFKLKFDEREEITPYAGLGIYGEIGKALGLDKEIQRIFPSPGSGAGYGANAYVEPLVLMTLGGGRHIEDIRKIQVDKALRKICRLEKIPSGDAIGDWLRRESSEKAEGLKRVNDRTSRTVIKKAVAEGFTLDIDAMGIEAEKDEARYTYKGTKGYMPLLGFLAEVGICIGYEFREGNVCPSEGNYEFTREIVEKVEKMGKMIERFRSDSAAYQWRLMNYLEGKGTRYTITAVQDSAVKRAIKGIKEGEWKRLKDKDGITTDRDYAEVIHSMEMTDHAFRLVIQRWANPQRDLFEESEEYCYHCIATNYRDEEKESEGVIRWHNGRGNSENYNKEVKIGFNGASLPCGDFGANGVWFGIKMLAYNLFIASKLLLFPVGWAKKTIETIRWQFIQMAGKIVRGARQLTLKLCSTMRETYEIYRIARERCGELQESG